MASSLLTLIVKRADVTNNVFALIAAFALTMFAISYAVGLGAAVIGADYPRKSKAKTGCYVEWDGRSNSRACD